MDDLATFDQLVDNGWRPIPVVAGTKTPMFLDWTKYCRRRMSRKKFSELLAKGLGGSIGIACGNVVAIDLDIDDPDVSDKAVRMTEMLLGGTPLHRIGREPRCILVYRTFRSFKSRSLSGKSGKIDVLASGRQFVAFGQHPGTKKPYNWIYESPLDSQVKDLPLVSQGNVDHLLIALANLLQPALNLDTRNRPRPSSSNSAEIIRDKTGQVIDGRDTHLRDIVLQVCSEAVRGGHAGDLDGLVRSAWQEFRETTVLSRSRSADGKPWTPEHARQKVRSTLRRLNNGQVSMKRSKLHKGGEWTKARKDEYDRQVRQHPDVTKSAVRVNEALLSDLNREGGDLCCPSIRRLTEETGLSEASVHRGLRWLGKHKFWVARGVAGGRYRSTSRIADLSLVDHIGARIADKTPENVQVIDLEKKTPETLSRFDTQNLLPSVIGEQQRVETKIRLRRRVSPRQLDLFAGDTKTPPITPDDLAWMNKGGRATSTMADAVEIVRHARGDTQADVARQVGLSRPQLTNIVRGRFGTKSEVAIETVASGGDTDTNAAICGALLGAAQGRDAVPLRWRRKILACRAVAVAGIQHPRPPVYWPDDALELAEALLTISPGPGMEFRQ